MDNLFSVFSRSVTRENKQVTMNNAIGKEVVVVKVKGDRSLQNKDVEANTPAMLRSMRISASHLIVKVNKKKLLNR